MSFIKKAFDAVCNAVKSVVMAPIEIAKNIGEGVKNLCTGNFKGLLGNVLNVAGNMIKLTPGGVAREVAVRAGAEIIGGALAPPGKSDVAALKKHGKGAATELAEVARTVSPINLWKH